MVFQLFGLEDMLQQIIDRFIRGNFLSVNQWVLRVHETKIDLDVVILFHDDFDRAKVLLLFKGIGKVTLAFVVSAGLRI